MKNKSDKSMNVVEKLKKVSDKGKQAESRLVKLATKKASKKKLVKQAGVVRELSKEEKKLTKKLSKLNDHKAVNGKEKVDQPKKEKVAKVKTVREKKTQLPGTTKVRKKSPVLPGRKTLQATKNGAQVSSDFSAAEAIARIGKMKGAEIIDSFVNGEMRKTVKLKAYKQKQSLTSKK